MSGQTLQFDISDRGTVTIDDVAQRAGVSASTVSRVLNGKAKASWPSMQRRIARIQKIALEMDYQPNMLSRALSQGKSMAVGLIVKGLSSPMTSTNVSQFMHVAKQSGYLTYTVNIDQSGDDSDQVASVARDLMSRKVDGLVILRNMPVDDQACAYLESLSIPVVFVGDWSPNDDSHRIVLDLESGIQSIATHLANLGHKKAAYFMSSGLVDFPEHKLLPYQRCFAKAGIELVVHPKWVIDSHALRIGQAAYEAVKICLAGKPDITALLMSNDAAAAGAVYGAREMGFRVPEDISIVGFDNVDSSEFAGVPLTTVGGPSPQEIGQTAFHMLETLIDDPGAKIKKKTFTSQLIERQSTAPAPGGAGVSGDPPANDFSGRAGVSGAGVSGTGVPPVIFAQQEESVGRISETHPPKQKVDALESRRAGISGIPTTEYEVSDKYNNDKTIF